MAQLSDLSLISSIFLTTISGMESQSNRRFSLLLQGATSKLDLLSPFQVVIVGEIHCHL